jgi:peptidoglycan/xylan/chitin deacetylase (PgdA/CDA1 family)
MRIVVFTGDPSHSVRACVVAIDEAMRGLEWLVLVHAPRKTPAIVARNQWRNLRRNGWRWIPYQLRDLRDRRRRRPDAATIGTPGDAYSARSLLARGNVDVRRVDDLNDAAVAVLVGEFAPDLGLSLAAPILRDPLFSLPRLGTLNLHKGALPRYRGMPPAFWELWNGEREIGCSVHRVDARLDAGDVVCAASVARARYSTLRGLQLALDAKGIELVVRAVTATLAGTARPSPQGDGGTTYRKPTLRQMAELEGRLARDAPNARPRAVALARDAAYGIAVGVARASRAMHATRSITVLLYHRVSDDARDNLTVGIEQFDRQMALLRRHCEVLSLSQVLAADAIAPSRAPRVCVTFDDGYLDNYENAVPSLLRHAVPAAFFVSTGMIGTDRPFPHDVRRGAARPPAMSWDQLRTMRDRGFTIGSHTVTHIDCAAEPESTVAAELDESRDDLARRLGVVTPCFAYPYGGRQHMTPARLELVKRAGYAACLSAYGGFNAGRVDRYNVLRAAVDWTFSDSAFLARCMGVR